MRIAICGPGRCGKDTVAAMLRDHYGLRYVGSTSYVAAPFVRKWLYDRGYAWQSLEECYEARGSLREQWAKAIDEYNADDPCKLYRDCLSKQDILTGLRRRREVQAVKASGLVDFWLWVWNPNCPPDPTIDYGPEECDAVIWNGGTIEELQQRLGIIKAGWDCKATTSVLFRDIDIGKVIAGMLGNTKPEETCACGAIQINKKPSTPTEADAEGRNGSLLDSGASLVQAADSSQLSPSFPAESP